VHITGTSMLRDTSFSARQHLSGAKPAIASGLLASASSPACSRRFVVCIEQITQSA